LDDNTLEHLMKIRSTLLTLHWMLALTRTTAHVDNWRVWTFLILCLKEVVTRWHDSSSCGNVRSFFLKKYRLHMWIIIIYTRGISIMNLWLEIKIRTLYTSRMCVRMDANSSQTHTKNDVRYSEQTVRLRFDDKERRRGTIQAIWRCFQSVVVHQWASARRRQGAIDVWFVVILDCTCTRVR